MIISNNFFWILDVQRLTETFDNFRIDESRTTEKKLAFIPVVIVIQMYSILLHLIFWRTVRESFFS